MEVHAVRPFDLQRGPVLRAGLIQLADEEVILLLVTHPIVCDGWSSGIIVREFVQCYEAWNRDEEPNLAELPIQYADYAVWQREWLRGEVLEEQLAYWRRELGDAERL